MAELFTADTYKNWTRVREFTKNGKPYCTVMTKCNRCGGTGEYVIPFTFSGTCYKCQGSGSEFVEARLYTKLELDYMNTQKQKRQDAKKAETKAKNDQLLNDSEKNKAEAAARLGFAPDYTVYLAIGDSYSCKDELKALGFRFNEIFGWYIASEVSVPNSITLVKVNVEDYYTWLPIGRRFDINVGAAIKMKEFKAGIAVQNSKSEYIGEEGVRFKNLLATFKSSYTFDSQFGVTTIYNFTIGDNILVWMTSKYIELDPGTQVELSATVKAHEVYKGEKVTKITRAKIATIG